MESDSEHRAPRFAYVVWNFPKLSETFVVEELTSLEELGLQPLIIARDRPAGDRQNDRAAPFLRRTTWLSLTPRHRQARSVARTVLRHPWRTLVCARLGLSTRSVQVVRNLWYACLLAREVERQRLEYLHAHFADTAGDLTFFAARLAGIPYGITVHAVDIYLGHLLCRKLRDASLWVTVCRYNLDQIAARCPAVDLDAALVKYAGVDVERFRLDAPRPLRPAEQIVAVGRLTPKKGFDQLVEAMARLRDEGFDQLRCTIVGDGRSRAQLESLIDSRDLGDSVRLTGELTPAEVRAELVAADVLVSPCTIAPTGNRDSMPVVIKEAMAMELPVVATDDFGIPEMVTADAGCLFRRDDVEDLTAALRSILTASPEARAEMGRAGRRSVIERFDERAGTVALASRLRAAMGAAT